jgi:hypothetical protein
MTVVVSALTKLQLKMVQNQNILIQKIRVYFRSNTLIQHTTPAQGMAVVDFGVQHQLMLI